MSNANCAVMERSGGKTTGRSTPRRRNSLTLIAPYKTCRVIARASAWTPRISVTLLFLGRHRPRKRAIRYVGRNEQRELRHHGTLRRQNDGTIDATPAQFADAHCALHDCARALGDRTIDFVVTREGVWERAE